MFFKDNGYFHPITNQFVVVGEIENDVCRPIHNVKLGIVLFDSDNNVIFDNFAPISLVEGRTTVMGDSKLPFILALSEAVSQRAKSYDFYRYQVGEDVQKETGLHIVSSGMELVERNDSMKYSKWKVTGQIKNEAMQTANNVRVVASLYGEDRNVVGVAGYSSNDKQPNNLKPKDIANFSLETVIASKFNVTSFYVYADSENVAFKTEFPCWPRVFLGYDIDVLDENGAFVTDPIVGQELFFQTSLGNMIDEAQTYAYFLQIKDEEGITVHLSWLTGTIEANGTIALSQAWVPEKAGTYYPEVVVWSSTDNPMPLSPWHSTSITII